MREPSTYLRRPMPCAPGRRAFPATKRNLALRFPHTQPQSPKEPAGATLGAGSRRRGVRTEKARQGAGQDGRPFPLSHGWRIGNPRSKPDPPRRGIDTRPRTRPFLSGSPQAWPRGWHPPALAPRRQGAKVPRCQGAKVPRCQGPTRCQRRAHPLQSPSQSHFFPRFRPKSRDRRQKFVPCRGSPTELRENTVMIDPTESARLRE
ncbi:hypothetical protein ACVKN3_003745 [Luteibacter sp. PvP120]